MIKKINLENLISEKFPILKGMSFTNFLVEAFLSEGKGGFLKEYQLLNFKYEPEAYREMYLELKNIVLNS